MITLSLSSARSAVLILLALLCGCNVSDISGASDLREGDCKFRTSDLSESYCRVSIYKLIVDAESFIGKSVYTVGYIEKGGDGSVGLAPSAEVFDAGDMDSCVVVTDYVLGKKEDADIFSAEGLYAVKIAGDFSSPVRGLCAGRLGNAVVTEVRMIRNY